MASFNKFNTFVGDLGLKVHNLNTDVLNVMLTNTAPVAGNTVKANITQVANGGGYTTDGATTANTYAQSGGTGTLTGVNVVFTATTGFGPFQYAVLFNVTVANGPLIGWWNYGSSITLLASETFTVSFGASVLTLA